jgi:hypothetical protein
MVPDSELYNPNPQYLRSLIEITGLSQAEAARRLGLGGRVMRRYLADRNAATALEAPYLVQFGLECLAKGD